jgi:hypothetical protein
MVNSFKSRGPIGDSSSTGEVLTKAELELARAELDKQLVQGQGKAAI